MGPHQKNRIKTPDQKWNGIPNMLIVPGGPPTYPVHDGNLGSVPRQHRRIAKTPTPKGCIWEVAGTRYPRGSDRHPTYCGEPSCLTSVGPMLPDLKGTAAVVCRSRVPNPRSCSTVEDGTGYCPANPHVQRERGAALETDISQDRITPICYTID